MAWMAVWASACTVNLTIDGEADPNEDAASRVMAYLDAYNERDIDAMMAMVTDNVEWISIVDSGAQIESSP